MIRRIEIAGEYKNVDEIAIRDGMAASLINGYIDAGALVRNPGKKLFCTLGTQKVDGLFWDSTLAMCFAVSNGVAYKLDQSRTFDTLTGADLAKGTRASFTSDGTRALFANGNKINYYSTGSAVSQIADTDAPTQVTHLGFLNGYIFANDKSTRGKAQFSEVTDYSSWRALDFFTAESHPDKILALHTKFGEVHGFGPDSRDVYYNTPDSVAPFARLDGAFIELGIAGAYAIAFDSTAGYLLSDRRHAVRLQGLAPVSISGAVNKVLQGLSTVSDCLVDIVDINGKSFVVYTFPTDRLTLAYDLALEVWYQWGYWNTDIGGFMADKMNAYCYAKDWNKHLVGDMYSGKIYELDPNGYDDGGDDLRLVYRTGFIDHGATIRKRSNWLRFRLKRGTVVSTEPKVLIRYRNEDGIWRAEREVSLGKTGDVYMYGTIRNNGIYRARQWEITVTDAVPFVLSDIEEDITTGFN